MQTQAQQVLSLDSCRAMALRNNKSLSASRLQLDMAQYTSKAAKTKYLPHVSAVGGYELTSRPISLLSKSQKAGLSNAGTNVTGAMHDDIANALGSLAQQGILTPDQATSLGGMFSQVGSKIGEAVNHVGQKFVDALNTNTRQMYAVSVTVTQPLYMGGAITAANKMAQIGEEMAQNNINSSTQQTLHSIDQAYWTVVSVKHKKRLAESYLGVVKKLDETVDREVAMENRPELKMLQNSVDLSRQATKLVRAAYMPQVLMMGGYLATNPNVYNGFERKLSGVWNVGVMVRVPLWNWMEGTYKVRASKIATSMVELERDDIREKIELQVSQSQFKVKEANRRLAMATKNVENAEENLRCANLGFKEGVLQTTDVMAAQTAWMQAQSQKIDAEVDVKLSQVNLKKALGVLQ